MIRTRIVGADDPVKLRGSGRTWRLIKEAPRESVFVAPNISVKEEAAWMRSKMGRDDVLVVGLNWLESGSWRGTHRFIVLDHCIEVVKDDRHVLDAHNGRAADRT